MDRRKFLGVAAAAGAAAAASNLVLKHEASAATGGAATQPAGRPENIVMQDERKGDMIYRPLGRTGEKVSLIGMGGFHIGNLWTEAGSVKLIRAAIDRGITFMDNCWDYHDGESEVRMGKALEDGYRSRVFLMTKLDGRTKTAAAKQIDQSLKRLQTDHIDLIQIHENIRMEDADRVFAKDGAIEAIELAKKSGKLRFVGFTGHKDPQVHLRMLEVAKQNGYRFDTAQMPLNLLDAHFRSFARNVVPVLLEEGMGVLGMKPLASGALMLTKTVTAIDALHYAMNLPTSVVITGIDSDKVLDQAFEAVRTFKPMSEAEVNALLAKTAEVAAKGEYEKFKTSNPFDSTAKHPEWLG